LYPALRPAAKALPVGRQPGGELLELIQQRRHGQPSRQGEAPKYENPK
jgi:hypothetical protein